MAVDMGEKPNRSALENHIKKIQDTIVGLEQFVSMLRQELAKTERLSASDPDDMLSSRNDKLISLATMAEAHLDGAKPLVKRMRILLQD